MGGCHAMRAEGIAFEFMMSCRTHLRSPNSQVLTPPHRDLIAQAHNGSGKTTCFVLSMLSRQVVICATWHVQNKPSRQSGRKEGLIVTLLSVPCSILQGGPQGESASGFVYVPNPRAGGAKPERAQQDGQVHRHQGNINRLRDRWEVQKGARDRTGRCNVPTSVMDLQKMSDFLQISFSAGLC